MIKRKTIKNKPSSYSARRYIYFILDVLRKLEVSNKHVDLFSNFDGPDMLGEMGHKVDSANKIFYTLHKFGFMHKQKDHNKWRMKYRYLTDSHIPSIITANTVDYYLFK